MTRARLADLPIDDIRTGTNVRRDLGDLDRLAASIRRHGILQPLVCIPSVDGSHVEILMGQRRLAAARLAGLRTVPCVLRPRPADRDRILQQLAENHERADMSPVDEACAFADLLAHGMSRLQIARTIHRDPGYVRRRLELLDLPDVLRLAVDVGWIRVDTALSIIPRHLLTDRQVVAELARIVRKGDQAVRGWVIERAAGAARRRSEEGVQFRVRIRPDLHARALADARRQGLSLAAWLEQLIQTHTTVPGRPDRRRAIRGGHPI